MTLNSERDLTHEQIAARARAAGIDVEPFSDENGEGFHWTGEPDMRMNDLDVMDFVTQKETHLEQLGDYHSTLLSRVADTLTHLW
jgi:hypothetical protein